MSDRLHISLFPPFDLLGLLIRWSYNVNSFTGNPPCTINLAFFAVIDSGKATVL